MQLWWTIFPPHIILDSTQINNENLLKLWLNYPGEKLVAKNPHAFNSNHASGWNASRENTNNQHVKKSHEECIQNKLSNSLYLEGQMQSCPKIKDEYLKIFN